MTREDYIRVIFQSTRPARGATGLDFEVIPFGDISIHAPREGRDEERLAVVALLGISIHAPREGRDKELLLHPRQRPISIHAPREGRDGADWVDKDDSLLFQSTRPARGATGRRCRRLPSGRYFNPRAPRGARPRSASAFTTIFPFQSTRPARGATQALHHHPLRQLDFNPRAPRGARLSESLPPVRLSIFQSTRPARGATAAGVCVRRAVQISIHAPREGRDICSSLAMFTS